MIIVLPCFLSLTAAFALLDLHSFNISSLPSSTTYLSCGRLSASRANSHCRCPYVSYGMYLHCPIPGPWKILGKRLLSPTCVLHTRVYYVVSDGKFSLVFCLYPVHLSTVRVYSTVLNVDYTTCVPPSSRVWGWRTTHTGIVGQTLCDSRLIVDMIILVLEDRVTFDRQERCDRNSLYILLVLSFNRHYNYR